MYLSIGLVDDRMIESASNLRIRLGSVIAGIRLHSGADEDCDHVFIADSIHVGFPLNR